MRILIFASGSGSNAENLVRYFSEPDNSKSGIVVGIVCNNFQAGVIERAKRLDIECLVVSNDQWKDSDFMLASILKFRAELAVLAGFLRPFPKSLIDYFDGNVINLHPALLPKFGGKGMYGINVHKAVISQKETQSGITIHWVNEQYDKGQIIAQFSCNVEEGDTAESLAQKIHHLEGRYFPEVVKRVIAEIS